MQSTIPSHRSIRNQSYRPWLGWALFLGLSGFWIGIGILVVETASQSYFGILLIAALLGFVFSFAIGARLMPEQVGKITLGDCLEFWPEGHLRRPWKIIEVAFGPAPTEDYADALPFAYCQVRIRLRIGRSIFMILSARDAAHLRDWAATREITVTDPDSRAILNSSKSVISRGDAHR